MTYEYECTKCGRTFEVEQRITDAPLATCLAPRIGAKGDPLPLCRGQLRRLISGTTTFVLKGAGWAKDGYGR